MGPIARFFSWLLGKPAVPPITKRMTINGIELEKILVHTKGREATLHEMLTVTSDTRFRIEGSGEGSGFQCSTEQWDPLPGETESATIQRIAREIAAKYPAMSILAFAWPGSDPTIIAVIVTLSEYKLPFAVKEQHAVAGGTISAP